MKTIGYGAKGNLWWAGQGISAVYIDAQAMNDQSERRNFGLDSGF